MFTLVTVIISVFLLKTLEWILPTKTGNVTDDTVKLKVEDLEEREKENKW